MGFGAIGIYAYLHEIDPCSQTLKSFNWIPLVAIVFQIIMRSAAILPMMNTLMNELYPTEIRTLAIGITQSALLISGFVTVKVFPDLKELIGLPSLCIFYFFIGVLMIIWGAISIPDNRGKSLVKVEEQQEKKPNDNHGYNSEDA